ncbi:MAG: 16S rRNA (guanine(966)-N(2))-methyltransferase RsmD [Pseudomonadales bacterium]|nr:16S rRNA (guanine(966)-N(2))-methyltransferase RsmD [Pseudomonadales bacterium]
MLVNEVRIIGGRWRGRKLKFPESQDLRPTLGRVRETLFNWLNRAVLDARCLDLFAGSGALGFEALSRGAAEVVLVDQAPRVAAALRASADRLEATSATIHCETAEAFLNRDHSSWDLVFFDPPFRYPDSDRLLELILKDHLAPNGLIYIERSGKDQLPHPELLHKHSRAGDCQFGLLARP